MCVCVGGGGGADGRRGHSVRYGRPVIDDLVLVTAGRHGVTRREVRSYQVSWTSDKEGLTCVLCHLLSVTDVKLVNR